MKNDREISLKAIEQNFYSFLHISKFLKNNKIFILNSIKINKKIYLYLSIDLQEDKEIQWFHIYRFKLISEIPFNVIFNFK